MKVGDLVRVAEPRACGGVPQGALGLVIGLKGVTDRNTQWVIWWLSGNEIMPGTRLRESVTYGYGVEVINENG